MRGTLLARLPIKAAFNVTWAWTSSSCAGWYNSLAAEEWMGNVTKMLRARYHRLLEWVVGTKKLGPSCYFMIVHVSSMHPLHTHRSESLFAHANLFSLKLSKLFFQVLHPFLCLTDFTASNLGIYFPYLPLAVFADLDANGWYTSPKSDSPFRIISHPVCSVFVASLFTIQQGSGRKFTFCGFLGLVSTSIQIWVSQWTNHFAQLTKIHQPENTSNIRRIYHWSILTNDNLPHSTCCFGHPVFSDQLEVIRNTRPFRPFSVLCFGTSQLFDLELS